MHKNRCNIFFYDGYIGISPTVINLALLMQKNNFDVVIFIPENNYPTYEFSTENITIVKINYQEIKNINNKFYAYFFGCIQYIEKNQIHLVSNLHLNFTIDDYDSIIGYYFFVFFYQPYYYVSLELNGNKLQKNDFQLLNQFETFAYSNASGVLIQNKERLNDLEKYKKMTIEPVFFVANSPIIEQKNSQNNFFRKRLSIPEKFKKTILYAGMIDEPFYSSEIAEVFSKIQNQSVALIMHERIKRKLNEPYIQKIITKNNKNLFLSLEPVEMRELGSIYNSIDIGIACYRPIDSNFASIGSASGKLAYLMQYGKPVIVNGLPSLIEIIKKYNCGKIIYDINNPNQWNNAINELLENYTFFSNNALKCYNELFDFEQNTIPLIKQIKKQPKNKLPENYNQLLTHLKEELILADKNEKNNNELNLLKKSIIYRKIMNPIKKIKQKFLI